MSEKNGIMLDGVFYPIPLENLFNKLSDQIVAKVNVQVQAIQIVEEKEFYTVGEAADRIRKSEATVARHIRAGILNATKVGKEWIIPKDSFDEYSGLTKAKQDVTIKN